MGVSAKGTRVLQTTHVLQSGMRLVLEQSPGLGGGVQRGCSKYNKTRKAVEKTSYRNVWKIEITKGAVEKEWPAAWRRARSDMQVAGEDGRYVCQTRVARRTIGSEGLLHDQRNKGRRHVGLAQGEEKWRFMRGQGVGDPVDPLPVA